MPDLSALFWPSLLAFINGALVSFAFACFDLMRRDPWLKLLSVGYLLLCLAAYAQQLPGPSPAIAVTYWAYMFAVSGSLPVFVYVAAGAVTHAFEQLLRHSPGTEPTQRRRWQRRLQRALRRGDLRLLEQKLAEVGRHPTQPALRSQLIDLYLSVGDHSQAAFHAYALAEMLPRGHAHGFALYRLAQILAEKQRNLPAAQPYLRRIIRLYPRSFFASYARRLVNQYEAYADRQ